VLSGKPMSRMCIPRRSDRNTICDGGSTSSANACREQIASFQRQFRLQERANAAERVDGEEHVFAKPESPVVHAGGGHGFGIGPILSILELSRSPSNSSCGNRSAAFALPVIPAAH
jgi:hypothetical protein